MQQYITKITVTLSIKIKNLHNFVYKQQLSRCVVRMSDTPTDTPIPRLGWKIDIHVGLMRYAQLRRYVISHVKVHHSRFGDDFMRMRAYRRKTRYAFRASVLA